MRIFREEFAAFRLAVQFLTRFPLARRTDFSNERMSAAARYYPLVGMGIGGMGAGVFWIAAGMWGAVLASLISTASTVWVTGAFHEDGFADACDGLGSGAARERVLEIMKDSRLGTYGVTGLALALACKVTAIAGMPPAQVPFVLIAAHGLSRLSSVLTIATSRYVRNEGTAKSTAEGISTIGICIATVTGLFALAILWSSASLTAAACGLSGLIAGHVLMRLAFERKLGGYTGDCLGAVQQMSEIGLYLGVLASMRWSHFIAG